MRGKDIKQMAEKLNNFIPIDVKKPSTFLTKQKDVLILDENKNVFYFHYNKEGKLTFNLPTGRYYSSVPVIKLHRFLPYPHGKYPPFAIPLDKIQLYQLENPNKASISLERLIVIVDPKFYNSEYKPLQTFTLLHELFHGNYHCTTKEQRSNKFYREFMERKCDESAGNWMLANGWNPVQVSLAGKMLLKSPARRACITDNSTGRKIRR